MTDIRQARPTTIATACCLCEVDIDANTVAVWYGSQKAHTACAMVIVKENEEARAAQLAEARDFDYYAAAANYRRLEGLADELTQQIIDLQIRLGEVQDGQTEVLKEAEVTALQDDEEDHDEWAGEAFNEAFHYYPNPVGL